MAKKSSPARGKKEQPLLEKEYIRYFTQLPIARRGDDYEYSLEQPSHLKWVQSETTYGVVVTLEPSLANA